MQHWLAGVGAVVYKWYLHESVGCLRSENRRQIIEIGRDVVLPSDEVGPQVNQASGKLHAFLMDWEVLVRLEFASRRIKFLKSLPQIQWCPNIARYLDGLLDLLKHDQSRVGHKGSKYNRNLLLTRSLP